MNSIVNTAQIILLENLLIYLQVAHSELLEVRPDFTEVYPGISKFSVERRGSGTLRFVTSIGVCGIANIGDLGDLVLLLRQAPCAL